MRDRIIERGRLLSQQEFDSIPPNAAQRIEYDCPDPKLSSEYVSLWLNRSRYGNFRLSDAIRPYNDPLDSQNRARLPIEGYRIGQNTTDFRSSYINLSVSVERIVPTILRLMAPLGDTVYAVVGDHSVSAYDDHITGPVSSAEVRAAIVSHSDLVCNDGFSKFAIFNRDNGQEVQLGSDKSLSVIADNLRPFLRELLGFGLLMEPALRRMTEGPHERFGANDRFSRLQSFKDTLGMEPMSQWPSTSF